MNNQIWLMSSAFEKLELPEIIKKTVEIGAQGIEVCVFRQNAIRKDHTASHINYEDFGTDNAQRLIDIFNKNSLKFSVSAYDNLIGGDTKEKKRNQNHLLKLIRMAHILGGDENDVKVGTFVGYNYELEKEDNGFQKNLEEYEKIFKPIIKYAEDLGVTILYENCPMPGWRPATTPVTYNNLPATLAARKLMYTLIPSKAHGETYDPSHDIWQHTDPVAVIKASDITRVHRIHVKGTRNLKNSAWVHWGGLYPIQAVDAELAEMAGVPTCKHDWDRHPYEATMPGFGGADSMDWKAFLETLMEKDFPGPFVLENEAKNSMGTENIGAIMQGFKAGLLWIASNIWPLREGEGYQFERTRNRTLQDARKKDIPAITIDNLVYS